MTAGSRAVLGALDSARPAIGRLANAVHGDEVAAAILEAWDASQDALRALIGDRSLGGQALIRELRQRGALTLDQAHALVEFGAAAERVRVSAYTPNETDIRAARVGFQQLESVVHAQGARGEVRGAREASRVADVEGQPGAAEPPPPETPLASRTSPLPSRLSHLASSRSTLGIIVALAFLVAIVGTGAFFGWKWWSGPRALERARAAYAAGQRIEAREQFSAIARRSPRLAEPHVYLGRMAREEGDRATAIRELGEAVRLEPTNATALREMAAYLLSIGDAQLASRFYVRAIEANPRDRTAMGYLACALVRLGRFDDAQRFLARAGQGPWSVCAVLPVPGPPVVPPPVR